MELIFSLSALLFFYTFIGYPLILKFLLIGKKAPAVDSNNELPNISIVLCIYNSVSLLEKRINNIFEGNYPTDKIQLIIVSDGSTDNPAQVIQKLNLTNIKFVEYPLNKGKSFALNEGIKHVTTDLVAFADVRQSFDKDALIYLAQHFSVGTTGAVSGNLHIIDDKNNAASDPGLYWKYEKWIREKESRVNSMVGVTGAIYMARKALIPQIPDNSLLDDMFIPLSMVYEGYKIKFESKAIAYDVSSSSNAEEFHRKVRTLAGNFQLLKQLPWLMSPVKNPLFFQFISHKFLRLITPYTLILMLLTSFLSQDVILTLLFGLQILFYGYSLLAYTLAKTNNSLPLGAFCSSFCSLQLAALKAGWKYYMGNPLTLWRKH